VEVDGGPRRKDEIADPVEQAARSQGADGSSDSVVLWELGRGDGELADQLVERQRLRVDAEDFAKYVRLVASVQPGIGSDVRGGSRARRVLISHEEPRLLVVRLPVGVSPPPGAAYVYSASERSSVGAKIKAIFGAASEGASATSYRTRRFLACGAKSSADSIGTARALLRSNPAPAAPPLAIKDFKDSNSSLEHFYLAKCWSFIDQPGSVV
jgi:hypothetical protein